MAKRRKPRPGEVVCRCGSYPFPHRQFGGRCVSDVLETTWRDQMYQRCRECRFFDHEETHDGGQQAICQVREGRDSWIEAECIEEHIQHHEIRLYGVNAPPRLKR